MLKPCACVAHLPLLPSTPPYWRRVRVRAPLIQIQIRNYVAQCQSLPHLLRRLQLHPAGEGRWCAFATFNIIQCKDQIQQPKPTTTAAPLPPSTPSWVRYFACAILPIFIYLSLRVLIAPVQLYSVCVSLLQMPTDMYIKDPSDKARQI
jgi:hypothetical protein